MNQSENRQKKARKKIGNYILCSDQMLGEGAIAKVYLCYNATNPELLSAVKVIDKKRFNADEYLKAAIKREFKIHSRLKHQNIVELQDMVETQNNIYIIQELCEGSTLKQVLREEKKLPEAQVLGLMKQLCHGYSELVNKGVIHRDLKPENILLAGKKLKIADFGFSKQVNTQKELLTSIVGSPIYMAPQILKGDKYNSKCDVWSFGIIVFQLLYGTFPWGVPSSIQNVTSLLKKILTEPLSFPTQGAISELMKDFIQNCLKSQENQRLSWLQVFQHPIFQGQFDSLAKQIRDDYQTSANLLNVLAAQVEPSHLIGAFLQFRVKALDFKLFSNVMGWLIPDATPPQVSIMYEMFDKDCNGVIDVQEFVKAFQVCDDEMLALLNQLIQDKGYIYEDLQRKGSISTAAKGSQYSIQAVESLEKVIANIMFANQ